MGFRTRVMGVAMCATCLAGLGVGGAEVPLPEGTVLYVAPEGRDSWSGTLAGPNAGLTDGPFATPARARDAVRSLKRAGPLAAPVTVMLRGGLYCLTEPLLLGPEDSGTAAASPSSRAAFVPAGACSASLT